jgi:high-affinity Fe2+/Pb2+ permease
MRTFRFVAILLLAAIVLLLFSGGWPAADSALFLFWCGLDSLLTLRALTNWLTGTGAADKRRYLVTGGLLGLIVVIIFTLGLAAYVHPVILRVHGEWLLLLGGAMMLSIGLGRRFAQKKALWRHRISLQASNALSLHRPALLVGAAFTTVLVEGAVAGAYVPVLMAYIQPLPLTLGLLLGALLLLLALWALPRLTDKRMVVWLARSNVALTIYLCVRFADTGIRKLQTAGYLKATPALSQVLSVTWEGAALQLLLLLSLLMAVESHRRRTKAFYQHINR